MNEKSKKRGSCVPNAKWWKRYADSFNLKIFSGKWVSEHGTEPKLPGLPHSPKQLFWVQKYSQNFVFLGFLIHLNICHQILTGGSGPDLVWQAETRSSQKQSIIINQYFVFTRIHPKGPYSIFNYLF